MAEIGRQASITVATPTQNSGTVSPVPQNSGTKPEVKETIKEKGLYEKFNEKVDWLWGPYDRSEL